MKQFNILDVTRQKEIVLEKGFFLSHYKEEGLLIDIYQMDDFFVKMTYLDYNRVASLRAFQEPE